MSELNATKSKFNKLKQNKLLRTVLICVLVLALLVSVTVAWYINNLKLLGMEFNTGNIEFNAYVFDVNGVRLMEPISSKDKNETNYINAPLITINNAQIGSTGTAYIAVESTGSIGIQYRIAFDISGVNEYSTAYLGGYRYNISKVTSDVIFDKNGNLGVENCPQPDNIKNEIVTIDRNAIHGTINEANGYDVYRFDYTLVHKNEDYTGHDINIYFNVFTTQIDGDFENEDERGYTYYCSTREDIDRVRAEAYPGDIIHLSSNIVYYGDLVFNKPINLITDNYTLTVNGNLMYDYVLDSSLKLDVGGLGKIIVQCTKEGVGGNFQIKAPIGDVVLTGSNASNGDIVVEKNVIVDATNAYGSSGISFNEVRIVDLKNSRKVIQLESNTRATISFGTTIGAFQSVVKANNIELVNNGTIGEINLSNMYPLNQTNSPQIYILNNNDINDAIMLPSWSVKFQVDSEGNCSGNTRIIQSYSGSTTTVSGDCEFNNADVEVEEKDSLVEQIEEGDNSRLRIYYRDVLGQTTSVQTILENYLVNTESAVNEVSQLEIICVGEKAITNADISFMNSDNMIALKQLDLQRANVYDTSTNTRNKLPDKAFMNVTKYDNLILPQNLVEIGTSAFENSDIKNIVTIPSGVIIFGSRWFIGGDYVSFASSVPVADAVSGLSNVKAIFVEESYIESYKSVYSRYENQIYPNSILDETQKHFIRNFRNDEWEITYFVGGEDAVIGDNITLDGIDLKVTRIYDNAYRYNFTGARVEFANTVEYLGARNFYENVNVTNVLFNNLKHIGDEAFYNNLSLVQVEVGNYLEVIGIGAFYNCAGLTQDIVLPDTMEQIGADSFQKTNISSINTGGAVSVGDRAFSNCINLIYAELPYVEVVGADGNNNLFSSDKQLVSVKMPSLKKAIGSGIFYGCSSLREFYMASNADDISLGEKPYYGCNTTNLKLFVPEDLIEFYRSKRPGNIEATMIYPAGEKMGAELVNGFNIGTYIVGDNGDNTYTLITSNIEHSGNLVIPEWFNEKAITRIYDNAFRNQKFTNVSLVIGNNVEHIGGYVFYKCGLVNVDFGDSLRTIGAYAFANCSVLSIDVVLPESMERIENNAFRETPITSVDTGGTTNVDSYAFYGCKALVFAKMPNVLLVGENGSGGAFYGCTTLVSVDMPRVAAVYGDGMFGNCATLKEIYMGSDDIGITLGTRPFLYISSANIKVFVPEGLVSFYKSNGIIASNQIYPKGEKMGDTSVNGFVIGDYIVLENNNEYTLVTSNLSFAGDVVIPDEYNNKPITAIYDDAFRNQSFADVNMALGNNIKTIGNSAFYGLTGLKFIIMDEVTTVHEKAFNGSGIQVLNAPKLTTVGNSAFRKCASLEIVNVPKIEIVESTYVFAECDALKSVYFENVMKLHSTTFYVSKALEKITINRVINSSGSNMPSAMTMHADAPCKIYVPYRSLTAYTATWSNKLVVSFDISATNNGDTFILSENGGKYTLVDFVPGQITESFVIPEAVFEFENGELPISAIEQGAFSAVADMIKNITLSSTIEFFTGAALSECTVLENIYVNADNMYFTSINGVLYSKDARMLVKYPIGRSGTFDMTEDSYASTTIIGTYAFANAAKLTGIVFSNAIMVLDGTSFDGCVQLKTVVFTGNTPPVLTGAGIFDTRINGFEMFVTTEDEVVIAAYLSGYNFSEYEQYMVFTNTIPE